LQKHTSLVGECANMLQIFVKFLTGRMFMAQMMEAVSRGMSSFASPWLDPQAAADWSYSSEGFVYQMADEGVIKRYGDENMPRFLKTEIDAAIREGRWQSAARTGHKKKSG